MLDLGQPPFPAEAVIEGNPMVIATTAEASMAAAKAPDDGHYAFGDNIPHKVRKGDMIPDGATFYGDSGSIPPHIAHQPEAIAAAMEAPPKKGKKGPSETTDAEGPSETT